MLLMMEWSRERLAWNFLLLSEGTKADNLGIIILNSLQPDKPGKKSSSHTHSLLSSAGRMLSSHNTTILNSPRQDKPGKKAVTSHTLYWHWQTECWEAVTSQNTCERSESAWEQRTALYKSNQQQQQQHHSSQQHPTRQNWQNSSDDKNSWSSADRPELPWHHSSPQLAAGPDLLHTAHGCQCRLIAVAGDVVYLGFSLPPPAC